VADPASRGNGHGHAGELSRRLEVLRQAGSGPQTLRQVGIGSADLDALALEAAEQWTAQFNPRPVSPAELRALYEEVL
jgi:alcohol dehydrogenase